MKWLVWSLSLLALVSYPGYGWERESVYSDAICKGQLRGNPSTLPSGLKPDCETEFAVVEFDWAKSPKHYECIGQALVYASQTGKTPVCALMAKNMKEFEFAESIRDEMMFSRVELRIFLLEP